MTQERTVHPYDEDVVKALVHFIDRLGANEVNTVVILFATTDGAKHQLHVGYRRVSKDMLESALERVQGCGGFKPEEPTKVTS